MPITNGAARLSQFKLFEGLSPDELMRAGALVDEQFAQPGDVLYRQAEMPNTLYLVESGEVLVEGRDPASGQTTFRRVAEQGDMVGRRAASEGVRHLTTATARQDAKLLTISARNLKILLNMFPVLRQGLARTDVVNRLMALPLFADFSQRELQTIADLIQVVNYGPGQTIFRKGDPADAMYVIDTGQVVESLDGEMVGDGSWPKYLAAGNFFGRFGVQNNAPRRASAVAETDVRLYRINREGLDWLLEFKPQFRDALKRPNMIDLLGGTHLFGKLSLVELKHLSGYAGLAHYRPGSIVMRQGEVDNTLYILYEGQALARSFDVEGKEKPVETLERGAVLGEDALFLNEQHPVTVEAPIPSSWLYLSRDDMDRFEALRPEVRDRLQVKPVIKERQRMKRSVWMDLDEHPLIQQRRHWLALALRLVIPVILALAGVFFEFSPVKGSHLVFTLLGTPLLVIGVVVLLWVVFDWRNDIYLVTNKRVAFIEKVILIRQSRKEVPLDKIQNINSEIGLVGNWFGYGTLLIDTAASFGGARITFNFLADPARWEKEINDARSGMRAGRRQETQRAIQEKLARRMGTGNQPRIPPIATARFSDTAPPPASSRWLRTLNQVPRLNPFWLERKTPDRVTWRKHWLKLVERIWVPTLLITGVVLALAALVIGRRPVPPVLLGLSAVVLVAAVSWWGWGYANWGNDLYIVTNKGLEDIERLPLGIRKTSKTTTFDKVQNVSYEIPNPVATLLNFGTVIIHTAGAEGRLDFKFVSRPGEVQAEIFRRLSADNEARQRSERDARWADLPDWFASYTDMTRREQS